MTTSEHMTWDEFWQWREEVRLYVGAAQGECAAVNVLYDALKESDDQIVRRTASGDDLSADLRAPAIAEYKRLLDFGIRALAKEMMRRPGPVRTKDFPEELC